MTDYLKLIREAAARFHERWRLLHATQLQLNERTKPMSTNKDIDHVSEGDTLAAQGVDFDLVRPVLDDGSLDTMVWKVIDPNKSSKQGTRRAELSGPRLPGSDKVEQRRQSVSWDRLVFVDARGEPLVVDELGRPVAGVKPPR